MFTLIELNKSKKNKHIIIMFTLIKLNNFKKNMHIITWLFELCSYLVMLPTYFLTGTSEIQVFDETSPSGNDYLSEVIDYQHVSFLPAAYYIFNKRMVAYSWSNWISTAHSSSWLIYGSIQLECLRSSI